jgi:hypothetical protein
MIEVHPFVPADLEELRLQPSQEFLAAFVGRPGYGQELVDAGPCYTARSGGRIVCCAGVVNLWEGRASAWALLSADAGRCMTALHRAVVEFLDGCGIERVEAYVVPDFMPGHRWARMLGFEFEGTLRAFQRGQDMVMYARVN